MSDAHAPDQPAPTDGRLDELAELVRAYNQVTDKLRHSHEHLSAEVARLRRELASADAQLQRSKRLSALGEMAAGIAHEIRNPLAAIQLYAQMVVEDLEPLATEFARAEPRAAAVPVALSNTKKIADAVRSLSAIVNDVLAFARQIEPEPRSVCVFDLLVRAVEAHRPELDAGVIDVEFDADPLDAELDGDLMQQALLNLVRNAAEAMEGRDDRRLTLGIDVDGDDVLIEVRDTGPGIAPGDVDRIFNPFFTTRRAGTGLGLPIVHRIVEAHGGTITVHNDDGAVFRVRLPRKVQPARRRESDDPAMRAEGSPASLESAAA